eukprot:TRINITY_DN5460_c0_g1_i2.p1 TRINITY_DN5460_c0_g1~~TRINITY_DN5460_c0_g1_i2.p1  ORF type:complete len:114 (-),score=18.06 TRINITY_DN5460_c0_g1_i2:57-398(-)
MKLFPPTLTTASAPAGAAATSNSAAPRVPLTEVPNFNILVVPQASLGGKLRGTTMQYHGNAPKDDGARLYDEFVALLRKEGAAHNVTVVAGTYGNRQALEFSSSGPFTHVLNL